MTGSGFRHLLDNGRVDVAVAFAVLFMKRSVVEKGTRAGPE